MLQTKLKFISQIAVSLHKCGAASYHIEDAVTGIAGHLCRSGEIFATPTQINCSVEDHDGTVESRLIRVYPSGAHLGKLSDFDALADSVLDGTTPVEDGLIKIKQITDAKDPWWIKTMPIAFSLSSGMFCTLFGGRLAEALFSALLGLGVFGLFTIEEKLRLGPLIEFLGAFLVTVFAHLLVYAVPDLMADKVVLGSLIVLVPGLSITVALAEISIKHLMSGTARLMGAFMELLKLSLGVFLGTAFFNRFFAPETVAALPEAPLLPVWFVLVVASVCFSILFKVKPRDMPYVTLVTFAGFYGTQLGTKALGNELGVFVGGALLSASSNLFARILKRPALTTLLPGLLPMVPGSIGFKSVSFLFAMEVIDSMTSAFSMLVVAMALVAGLSFGHILVHPRRSI